ncbi:DUF2065 domain-containing protein [Micavibrio aeruginosavorus]|uniref:DUF2065 domain-containing protein n=1 Tax=Micavibrio aeruginosavorus TaxID=349221 RepID=UPI003F4A92F1
MEFAAYILTAFCLIFVIEGLVYALFPDMVRRMMAMAIMLPVQRLRLFGAIMAISGLCLIWIIRGLIG